MNKTNYDRIVRLYKEGIAVAKCVGMIIDLSILQDSLEAANWIHKFYTEAYRNETKKEKEPRQTETRIGTSNALLPPKRS